MLSWWTNISTKLYLMLGKRSEVLRVVFDYASQSKTPITANERVNTDKDGVLYIQQTSETLYVIIGRRNGLLNLRPVVALFKSGF